MNFFLRSLTLLTVLACVCGAIDAPRVAAYIQGTFIANSYCDSATAYSSRRIFAKTNDGVYYAAAAFSVNQNNQPPYALRIYSSTDGGGAWTMITDPSITIGNYAKGFTIAVDSTGALHLTWHAWETGETGHIYYKKFSGGSWSANEQVSATTENGGRSPQVAIDSTDAVNIVWQTESNGTTYYRKKTGTSWSSIQNIGNLGAQTSLAVDYINNLHVVGGYTDSTLKYVKSTSGSWGTVETISTSDSPRHASIVVDSSNNPHVVWCDDGYATGKWKIFYSTRTTGWSARSLLSDSNISYHDPNIAIDISNTLYVFSSKIAGLNQVQLAFTTKPSAGPWTPEVVHTEVTTNARAAQFRWSAWPTGNRVTGESDLDLVYFERESGGSIILYPIKFNRGLAQIQPTPTPSPSPTATPLASPTPAPVPAVSSTGWLILALGITFLLLRRR